MYKRYKLTLMITLIMTAVSLQANPMRPDTSNSQSGSRVQIQAPKVVRWPSLVEIIEIGDYRKVRLSNGLELAEGESQKGYKALLIDKYGVELQRGHEKKRLLLDQTGESSVTPAVEGK